MKDIASNTITSHLHADASYSTTPGMPGPVPTPGTPGPVIITCIIDLIFISYLITFILIQNVCHHQEREARLQQMTQVKTDCSKSLFPPIHNNSITS